MTVRFEERFPGAEWAAFFCLHRGLLREGPGSDACTRHALSLVGDLGASPVVFDLGCGPGAHTLVLARELGTKIVAIDVVPHFLAQLRERARELGLDALVETRLADMAEPFAPIESVDLIWAEGSIYMLGFESALRIWRPLLRPGGFAVVTEATWLVADPPPPIRAFWQENMPTMTDISGNVRRAETAGYEISGQFPLPPEAWLDEYYAPLDARARELEDEAKRDEAMASVLAEHRQEVEMYRRWGHTYGYVAYVLKRAKDANSLRG